MSRLLAYFQLLRLPNLFTAVADVMMGYLFVQSSLGDGSDFWWLLGASCLLYAAGMVLNDVFDYEVDARERPGRPIPSGRIRRQHAAALGWGMLLCGATVSWLAGFRSGVVGSALAAAVVLYDGVLKRSLLGPFAMGCCRLLNVLLGMSGAAVAGRAAWLGFTPDQLLVAAGIGVYVSGVTWFARSEAVRGGRATLVTGLATMGVGIGLLAIFPWARHADQPPLRLEPTLAWPGLLFLLSLSIFWRSLLAILDPSPERVQQAVKHCIASLIVLDAAVCLAVRGPIWSLAILALLIPMLVLGRWIYST
jgi:4-hydroxybenzoate polyprenyltransferase